MKKWRLRCWGAKIGHVDEKNKYIAEDNNLAITDGKNEKKDFHR